MASNFATGSLSGCYTNGASYTSTSATLNLGNYVISTSPAYYGQQMAQQAPAKALEPPMHPDLAWLDQRVREMQVAL